MKRLIIILLLLNPVGDQEQYPLKNGRPTSEGIEQYIEDKGDSLIIEFENFIDDTLFNVWIYAEDLTLYDIHDSLELGRYYPHEIFINTAEKFQAYELGDLSRLKRAFTEESNKFVKATVMHELTHEYIYQIGVEMQMLDQISVHRAYHTYIWIIRTYENFGSTFIEEGICEYVTGKMGEIIPPRRPELPRNVEELIDRKNRYEFQYKYSAHYLKPFLDTTGLKRGVKILLHNPPPAYEEILEPEQFFNRLIIPPLYKTDQGK
ncbi:MAG: hypothetical protein R6U78_05210 [Bacteroidales bacterium]